MTMRIKQSPNGDFMVDIDSDILARMGLTVGDAVYWDQFGKLKAGYRTEKVTTPDGVFSVEINRIDNTAKLIVELVNHDRVIVPMPTVDHISNLASVLTSAERIMTDA